MHQQERIYIEDVRVLAGYKYAEGLLQGPSARWTKEQLKLNRNHYGGWQKFLQDIVTWKVASSKWD
jgi:hypothetical protein